MPQRQVVGLAPSTGTANTQWGAVKFSDSCPEPPDQAATLRYRVRPPGLIKNPAILPLRGVAGCASGLICRAPRCPRRGGVPRTVARPLKRPGPIQKSDAEAKMPPSSWITTPPKLYKSRKAADCPDDADFANAQPRRLQARSPTPI